MLIPVLPLILLTPFLVAAPGGVPAFNVEPSCRGGMNVGPASEMALYRECLKEEAGARKLLQKQWTSFPRHVRESCASTAGMGTPSYVELLTCLQMTKQTITPDRNWDKKADKPATTGKGQK